MKASLPQNAGLLFAFIVVAVFYAASVGTVRLTPAYPELLAQNDGVFPVDGQFHGEPLNDADGVRRWGSLAGADENTGAIVLGPFIAPARLRFGVTGFPVAATNEIVLELTATGERVAVQPPSNPGPRWNIVDVDVPPGWVGKPVRLHARDGTRTAPGWFGITEPVQGGRGDGLNGLRQTLAAWAVNGLLLGLMGWGALTAFTWRNWVAPQWAPLGAAAVIATLGYVGLWIYFVHATAGKIFSIAVLLAALSLAWGRSRPPLDRDAIRVGRLMAGVGTLYLALLHLFPSSLEFDALAANRFREEMPGDNTLPYNFAAALVAGRDPRTAGADYQSSDRPPLQSGWLLLTWPVTRAMGLDERAASGTAAVWFQLLWIPAAYGLLVTLRMTPSRAAAWTGVIGLSGFFLQNTVFTWPKLAAAAFTCGAFGMWLLPSDGMPRRASILIGAVFAALAWLSHGGVAFSLLALAPWLGWRARTDAPRDWLLAVGAILLFAAPWTAYQKLYDPPGNLLLKEHLAGVDTRDPRSTWATVRESYQASSWSEIIARKRANFLQQFDGRWTTLVDASTTGASLRRSDEFFHTARALTWWTFAPLALLITSSRVATRRTPEAVRRASVALLGWALLTVAIWCLLLFHGGHAVIHQGSYAVLLTFFVLCSLWLEWSGRWTVLALISLQAATLVTTYAVANSRIHGPAVGLPVAVAAGALYAWVIGVEIAASQRDAQSEPLLA